MGGLSGAPTLRPQGRNLKLNDFNVQLLSQHKRVLSSNQIQFKQVGPKAIGARGLLLEHYYDPPKRPVTEFYDRLLYPTQKLNLRNEVKVFQNSSGAGQAQARRASLPPKWRSGAEPPAAAVDVGRGRADSFMSTKSNHYVEALADAGSSLKK